MDSNYADLPDELWDRIKVWIPTEAPNPKGGQRPIEDRRVMSGIIYRLRTGCQWDAIPAEFGSGSTCFRRFKRWRAAGVFAMAHVEMLIYYDDKVGIEWDWASLDSASVKAPKGGDLTGPNPTDRAKLGTKRHVLTDGQGIPLAVTLTGANVHDMHMVGKTLDAVPLRAPRGTRRPKNLCLDKGYDYEKPEREARDRGVRPHIRRRGEPALTGPIRGKKARRWVVERTNSWHNNFRGLRIRWERTAENHLAFVQLACALICFQAANR